MVVFVFLSVARYYPRFSCALRPRWQHDWGFHVEAWLGGGQFPPYSLEIVYEFVFNHFKQLISKIDISLCTNALQSQHSYETTPYGLKFFWSHESNFCVESTLYILHYR